MVRAVTSEPWRADRELSEAGVRAAMREQFPELALRSADFLASGWDYDAYLIDRDLVVRFPRRAEVADRLHHEEAILHLVRSSVGATLSVPEITIRGEGGVHFPHRFFAHVLIPGVAADHPGAKESAGLASDLAEAHDWLRAGPSLPPEYGGPPRFVHNDFCPDHILVDPESGRLTGVIDWSDAALGDPALDFVMLVLSRGWDFVNDVVEAYRLPLDTGFHQRLESLARVLALKWLADEITRKQEDVDKCVSWVENAFADWKPGET